MNDKQKKWIEENLPKIKQDLNKFEVTDVSEKQQLILEVLGIAASQGRMFVYQIAANWAYDWYLDDTKEEREASPLNSPTSQVVYDEGEEPE